MQQSPFPLFNRRRRRALALGLAATATAAACVMPGAARDTPRDSAPLRCEIVVSGPQGAPTFQGRVEADRPISGTYRMEIRRLGASGDARISQSGDFEAAPGAPATVGRASFGGDRAGYEALLTLRWDGGTTSCRGGQAERSI